MNTIEDQAASNVEPLSKILRKRKSKKTSVQNGLWDIKESRFENQFYSMGRSLRGSGSQCVTSKRMDGYEQNLPRSESTKSVPYLNDNRGKRDFIGNTNLRRSRYVKNIKPAVSHRKLQPTKSLPTHHARIFKSNSFSWKNQNDQKHSTEARKQNDHSSFLSESSFKNDVVIVHTNDDNMNDNHKEKKECFQTTAVTSVSENEYQSIKDEEDNYCYTYSDWISPAVVIQMEANEEIKDGEENIYEEIKHNNSKDIQNDDNVPEEPFSLLHGISEGRRETIRNYALADWDFEQKYQKTNYLKDNTRISEDSVKRGRSFKETNLSVESGKTKVKPRSKSQYDSRKKKNRRESLSYDNTEQGQQDDHTQLMVTPDRRFSKNAEKLKLVLTNKFIQTMNKLNIS